MRALIAACLLVPTLACSFVAMSPNPTVPPQRCMGVHVPIADTAFALAATVLAIAAFTDDSKDCSVEQCSFSEAVENGIGESTKGSGAVVALTAALFATSAAVGFDQVGRCPAPPTREPAAVSWMPSAN